MIWKCKYCIFACDKRGYLLKHYRLKHGSYARSQPFPCLYQECLCSFKSFNSLKYTYPVFIQQLINNRRENLKLSFAVNFVIFLNPVTLLNILPTFGVDISKTTKKFNVHFKAAALKVVYIPRSVHTKVSITKIKMRECLNQS